MEKNIVEIDKDTMECLTNYEWPGNIRELKNVIFRLVLIAKTPVITLDLLEETVPGILKFSQKHN